MLPPPLLLPQSITQVTSGSGGGGGGVGQWLGDHLVMTRKSNMRFLAPPADVQPSEDEENERDQQGDDQEKGRRPDERQLGDGHRGGEGGGAGVLRLLLRLICRVHRQLLLVPRDGQIVGSGGGVAAGGGRLRQVKIIVESVHLLLDNCIRFRFNRHFEGKAHVTGQSTVDQSRDEHHVQRLVDALIQMTGRIGRLQMSWIGGVFRHDVWCSIECAWFELTLLQLINSQKKVWLSGGDVD